ADLERSIEFYVDLVGLELYSVEPTYDRRPESLGYELFNIDAGSRKRMAMLNTSAEIRGMTLQEVRDMQWSVQQKPRTSTILFETDDLVATIDRVRAAGYQVIEPVAGEVPAALGVPALRFLEGGVIDPDGHVISFFQYFADDDNWQRVRAEFTK
ncbi:MAG TPA: VOC family protein, partial [Steroidobacteraceae bacterium]|nr:VOC family protein [Steroidobacteraceae bacterium]